MNNTEIKTVELVINSQQANKKLDEINAKLEKARQKKMEAFEKRDSAGMQVYGKEIAKLEREQHRLETRAKSITRVLQHIDKATPNELKKTIREINKELNSGAVERGSKEWNTLTHSLREANRQLKEIKEETNASRSLSDRFADWGNKWVGISSTIYTGVQTLTGIKTTAMEAVNAFAEMEEAESQAVKYTELSKEAVKELNEEFKRLDTRTPREKLNELAGDAGRLGVTTKEAVMEFVEGGNMINVALGEDLGDDAVKNIGKIVQFFGNDKVQGWKQAMLSTGSVVNTLGQTSSANEGYIVDFTYRLAGMGHQAGLAQTQIMGYASVLDQAMVNSEEGSTALSKIIQKMFREPEKLAKAAGLNVQEFTKLVKTDANEALLEFATATERMGGLERIAPMLGDLSLTGAGVSKTLSALAKDVNKVRETQQLAAQSFAEGTSIVNEYNVANNTVQANLEKARNAANDLRVELGEQLQPIIAEGIHLGTATMKLATEILKFASENRAAIISTTVAIAGYTVKVNASIIADKAKVLWTNRVKVAVSGLWKTLRANPWGVVIAAAGLAIGALIDYQRQQDKTTAKMRAEANIRKKAGEQYQSEADRIKTLREQIENNNLSLEFRRKRLEELKSIVPGYLADLTDEGTLVNNNTTALDGYLKKLEKEIRLKAVREELEELYRNKRKAENRLPEEEAEFTSARNAYYGAQFSAGQRAQGLGTSGTRNLSKGLDQATLSMKSKMDNAAEAVRKTKAEIVDLDATIAALSKEINEGGLIDEDKGNSTGGGGTGGGGLDEDAIKAELKRIEEAAEIRKLAERMKYETGVTDREEYSKALLRIDADMYQAQQALYSEDSADWAKLEQKRLDAHKGIKEQEKAWSIRHLEIMQAEEEEAAKRSYLKGETTEKDHAEKMLDIRIKFLRKRADLERKAGNEEEAAKAEAQAEQLLLDDKLKKREKYMQDLDRLRERYLTVEEGSRTAQELAILDELLRQKLIKEEEYQKLKKKIQEKGEDKQQKEEQNEFLSTPTDNISAPLIRLMEAFTALNQKIKDGEATWQDYAAVAVTSIQLVSGILSSVSQLMQANQDAEIAKVEKKYDAEIEAAGANTAKGKKLEEQKQKEVAAIKTKYSKKQMKIEIAQALAQTAMAAINAYSSAAAIPVTGWIMAPIAAAAAVAAGMLQIAAIKKQHEAQQTGYYEGGFTGGSRYRRVAGEVHEGEFVANHLAVKNPQILPALRLIDQAQRNNTISSLTAADVSEALGYAPRSRGSAAPARGGTDFVTDDAVWTAVTATMERTTDTLDSLNRLMDDGLDCRVTLDGPQGLDRQQRKYEKLNSNAHR